MHTNICESNDFYLIDATQKRLAVPSQRNTRFLYQENIYKYISSPQSVINVEI